MGFFSGEQAVDPSGLEARKLSGDVNAGSGSPDDEISLPIGVEVGHRHGPTQFISGRAREDAEVISGKRKVSRCREQKVQSAAKGIDHPFVLISMRSGYDQIGHGIGGPDFAERTGGHGQAEAVERLSADDREARITQSDVHSASPGEAGASRDHIGFARIGTAIGATVGIGCTDENIAESITGDIGCGDRCSQVIFRIASIHDEVGAGDGQINRARPRQRNERCPAEENDYGSGIGSRRYEGKTASRSVRQRRTDEEIAHTVAVHIADGQGISEQRSR